MPGETLKSLRTPVVTIGYPKERTAPPAAFRGAPEIRLGGVFAALPSPEVCPTGAITLAPGTSRPRYTIDLARCIFCGNCQRQAAGGGVEIGHDFELAARRREDLLVQVESDRNGHVVAVPDTTEPLPPVAAEIQRVLGRSLNLRHLDAGSCNACDWELTALLNPFYDVRRLGIDFVASPRHADGVIVTGAMTRNLELAAKRTYAAMPEPRIVIAVGACASSGGIVGRSYASAGGIADVLPVDVFIPGCPPRPEAILFGILLAVGRIAAR